jgi:hypothetical protein
MADLKSHLITRITEGKLEDVFAQLRPCFPNGSENNNAVIVQQSAWKAANNKLNGGSLTFQDLQTIQNQISFILLRLIDQIPDTDFEKAISELDLSEIGTISLVNCDRKSAYDTFKSFFRQQQALPFQFYFIVGCPSQEPDSFAERLIYEVLEDVLMGEDNAIDFIREKGIVEGVEVERVEIPLLPMAFDADKSQLKFKKEFGKRLMRFNMTDVSLEDFIGEKAAQLKYDYFTFLYQLESDEWDTIATTPYIQWLVETFKKNKVKQPTFLFFFVVNMENAHIQKREDIMVEIHKIIAQNPESCGLIDALMPLQGTDLNRWVRERGERSQAKIDDLVKKFSANLALEGKLKADGTMDMTHVEPLQGKIFAHFMKKNL